MYVQYRIVDSQHYDMGIEWTPINVISLKRKDLTFDNAGIGIVCSLGVYSVYSSTKTKNLSNKSPAALGKYCGWIRGRTHHFVAIADHLKTTVHQNQVEFQKQEILYGCSGYLFMD